LKLLGTRAGRLLTFSLLYLSEGIPFGFSAIALTVYLRQGGVGLAEIGAFTGSLYAPWGFKWAWAPIVDLVNVRRFGHRRFWIMLAQMLMILTLGMIMFFDVSQNLALLTLLIAIHNVFAATQDVAIDALAIEVLPERERGVANGFMFGSSYLGQAIGGSGALFVAAKYGWAATFPFVCAALGLILAFVVFFLREPAKVFAVEASRAAGNTAGFFSVFLERLRDFFRELYLGFFKSGPGPLVGVVLAMLPVGAIALGLALGSTMQVDLGMTEDQIAKLTLWTTVAAALGCVAGGWIADKIGHRLSLAIWVALTTVPTILLSREFTGSAMEGVTLREFWNWMVIYSFAAGLTNAASIAVYMGLTSPKIAGTQFTGYMALKNLVYTYSSNWQGRMAEARGYPTPLRLDCLIALLPILLYPWLRPSTRSKEPDRTVLSHPVLHPEAADPVPTLGKGV
jgi:PAT family beta-lactamase induction signal transducer AmpG